MNAHQVVDQAERLMDQYLEDLKTTVNIDSGTYTKSGIDQVGAYLQERFQALVLRPASINKKSLVITLLLLTQAMLPRARAFS